MPENSQNPWAQMADAINNYTNDGSSSGPHDEWGEHVGGDKQPLAVKFQHVPPSQEHEDIIMPLTNSPETADDEHLNRSDIDQTLVYGIMCPIICIAGLVISYEDIIDFQLYDNDHMPSISCHVYDNKNIIQQLNPPSQGNTIINVQIIPSFDNCYQKICANFIMTDFSVGSNNDLYVKGSYFIPEFISKKFKSFGKINLYDLYETIAKEIGLGFYTNVEKKDDERYVFCRYSTYKDIINNETANTGDENHIYDWYIDAWHFLTFVDIYGRYNANDNLNEMDPNVPSSYLWITNQNGDATIGTNIEPYRSRVLFTNLFGFENSQLFVKDYRVINNLGSDVYNGTHNVYSVYSMKDKTYNDILFQDSTINEKNAISNFIYKGEVYGDYDYITASLYKDLFLQKMKKEIIEIDLQSPVLGLTRGRQIVLSIYINEGDINASQNKMEEEGFKTPYLEITPQGNHIELIEDDEESNGDNHFKLDKSISSQYLVIGNIYKYSNHEWTQTVQLVRPDDRKIDLMK